MASYVKYETPDEVVTNILEALSVAKDTGKLRKGINETTKSIERKNAKLVVMAEDIQPEEIIIHVPSLCEEKGIPYAYVRSKKDLGSSVGIGVGTSSIAIEDAGSAAELLQGILKRLPRAGASASEKKEEKPREKPKKEEKPKEKKKPEEKPKEEPVKEEPKPEEKKEEKPKEEPKKEEKPEEKPEEKKE
ncbi:50S ribosomal protein L7ae [Candidatus Micrarchaeota archaeon]|nr:50S ribosomal protein L7ae [Candidatus Micrarchaeota archaeon]